MTNKHSLRIALARAVLAGSAELYHFRCAITLPVRPTSYPASLLLLRRFLRVEFDNCRIMHMPGYRRPGGGPALCSEGIQLCTNIIWSLVQSTLMVEDGNLQSHQAPMARQRP